MKVYDLDTERWTASLEIPVRSSYPNLAWHPGGRILAITCEDRTIKLWNLDQGNESQLLRLERTVDMGSNMAFNHRGDRLATAAWDGVFRLWDPRTGSQLRTLDWRGPVPRFSPDDRLVAASTKENSIQLWEITAGEECRAFVRGADRGHTFYGESIDTEGRLLAVGMDDGVGLWDLKTADFLFHLPIGETHGVAFDHSVPGALLTNGLEGVYRWPVQAEPKSARMRIGPPKTLPLPGNFYQIAVSRDGQFVAQPAGQAAHGCSGKKRARWFVWLRTGMRVTSPSVAMAAGSPPVRTTDLALASGKRTPASSCES